MYRTKEFEQPPHLWLVFLSMFLTFGSTFYFLGRLNRRANRNRRAAEDAQLNAAFAEGERKLRETEREMEARAENLDTEVTRRVARFETELRDSLRSESAAIDAKKSELSAERETLTRERHALEVNAEEVQTKRRQLATELLEAKGLAAKAAELEPILT